MRTQNMAYEPRFLPYEPFLLVVGVEKRPIRVRPKVSARKAMRGMWIALFDAEDAKSPSRRFQIAVQSRGLKSQRAYWETDFYHYWC